MIKFKKTIEVMVKIKIGSFGDQIKRDERGRRLEALDFFGNLDEEV